MKLPVRFVIFLSVYRFLLFGCSDNPSDPNPPGPNQGRLTILLTDAPADLEAINLTFSEVSAHIDSGWVILSSDEKTINLLDFTNGNTTEIGSADVPVGRYNQIRLKIKEAEIIIDGITNPLDVPSGAQSGLKLNTDFEIVQGSTVELVVDFDADRSIVTTGPPNNPTGYKLKPVLRVISRAVTGSISGTVTNFQNIAVAYAIAGGDTITSASVSAETGGFMLAFLPEGNYLVSIRDAAGSALATPDVPVVAGSDNDLGTLTLLPAQSGKLVISLTDAPAVFDAVNITFSEISAHIDNEWQSVLVDPVTVNLLEFSNGRTIELGSADVPAGKYTQVRILVDDAKVIVEGVESDLDVPSGARTGLKLGPPFTVREGSTVELILDFDATRSVVVTGPPSNPRSYILKPRIRVITADSTGSITGTVTNPENLPIAYAIAGTDTVTSTAVDMSSGQFKLAFLPEDLYTVSVRDTLDQSAEVTGVQVIARQTTEVGQLTLQ